MKLLRAFLLSRPGSGSPFPEPLKEQGQAAGIPPMPFVFMKHMLFAMHEEHALAGRQT